MGTFISDHLLEIFFGLISAGALGVCKYLLAQVKNYRKLLDEKEDNQLDETIEDKLEPIKNEIEELRKYIRDTKEQEHRHIELIISSYKFRLVQLCRIYLRQGFITQDQYDQLAEFYKLYSALGGNGQAEEYYQKTMDLEIRPN